MFELTLFNIGVLLIVVVIILMIIQNRRSFLPGPLALPIIGHLHLIGNKSLHVRLTELSMKYGKIFQLQLGQKNAVVLASRELIKEAFVSRGKVFSSRPDLPLFRYTRNGRVGISLCPYDEKYIKNRKLAMRAIHSCLKSKEDLSKIFDIEMKKMVNLLDSYVRDESSFFPLHAFQKIVPSLFLSLMSGCHYDYNDKEFVEIVNCYEEWFQIAEADNPSDFFPVLEYIPNFRLNLAEKIEKGFEKFSLKALDEKTNYDGTMINCLQNSDINSNIDDIEDKFEKAKIVSDLLGGGFDTVTSSLSWALIYLADRPHIIEKCRDELKNVSNSYSVKDYKINCPYFYSVFMELLRYTTIAPLGVVRETTEDSKLGDYWIPKGTIVIPNLWQVNHDSMLWRYPEEFNPHNFYLPETNSVDSEALKQSVVFSEGVRKCPGYELSQKMLSEVLKTFIMNYSIIITKAPEDMQPERGLTLKPKHYEVKLVSI